MYKRNKSKPRQKKQNALKGGFDAVDLTRKVFGRAEEDAVAVPAPIDEVAFVHGDFVGQFLHTAAVFLVVHPLTCQSNAMQCNTYMVV